MKIIHTADWHLGQQFFQYDRSSEHEHFFDCLCRIIADERPDALVVSGDVYHNATPSNGAMKLFTDNMVRLHNVLPEMVIVVTAGNHDSCSRLESTGEVWRLANVHVVGGVRRNADSGLFDTEGQIIEITDKGYILAVPFVQSNNTAIFGQLLEETAALNTRNLPVVMTGHLYVSGADLTGHNMAVVGGIEGEDIALMGTGYDYLALGHIHCPQTIKGSNGSARYSGSPVQVDFDETYPHSVTIVEIVSHGAEPVIRTAEIERKMRFYTIPGKPQPFDDALACLRDFVPDKPGYVRLNLLVKDYAPSFAEERVYRVLESKPQLKFCYIRSEREQTQESARKVLNIQDVRETSPMELAQIYYNRKVGTDMDPKLWNLLSEVVESVRNSED